MYEILQVEAWADGDGGWTYNNAFRLGTMKTAAKKPEKAFRRWLSRKGVCFKKYATIAVDDGYVLEIQDRKTGEPLFAAVCADW